MKVVTILIPSFDGLRWERLGARPPFWFPNTKKKNGLQILTLGATERISFTIVHFMHTLALEIYRTLKKSIFCDSYKQRF